MWGGGESEAEEILKSLQEINPTEDDLQELINGFKLYKLQSNVSVANIIKEYDTKQALNEFKKVCNPPEVVTQIIKMLEELELEKSKKMLGGLEVGEIADNIVNSVGYSTSKRVVELTAYGILAIIGVVTAIALSPILVPAFIHSQNKKNDGQVGGKKSKNKSKNKNRKSKKGNTRRRLKK